MSNAQSYPPSFDHRANRTWPSISTNTETDVTTPSLCSDNDIEREGDTPPDDQLPSTPPDVFGTNKKQLVKQREIIDVDMVTQDENPVSEPPRPAPPPPSSPHIRRLNDVFAKRPPTSPMPDPSPRKPRPPARPATRNLARAKPPRRDTSDDEDPLSLSFSSVSTSSESRAPIPRKDTSAPSQDLSQPSGPPTRDLSRDLSQPTRNQKQLTLEEELFIAGERDWTESDLDSGVLVGVGMRDKRAGFLAHGGAGGVPVFMGVGYVEGAEEAEEDRPQKKKTHKQPPAKRRTRR